MKRSNQLALALCNNVANKLSFHNAAEGESRRQEAKARDEAYEAWRQCRLWLFETHNLVNFLRAGNYLISGLQDEVVMAFQSSERGKEWAARQVTEETA